MALFTRIIVFFSFVASTQTGFTQCPINFDTVRLEIDPDVYFEEISWKIYEKSNPQLIYESGVLTFDSLHIFNHCIPQGDCKVLEIADDQGDGMFPDGVYRLFVNGVLIRQSIGFYGSFQVTDFGCPPGATCYESIPVNLGSTMTPDGNQTWFSFIPSENGIYTFSTCGASCATKIWVYDTCDNLFLSEGLPGAIFYSETGCPNGEASATAFLEGGKTYYFRVRYFQDGCSPNTIPFDLVFDGPVIGCMDPTACNYEPLATVDSGNCLENGDPDCPYAPDIAIDESLLRSTIELADHFNDNPCLLQEGCVTGFGMRHIIRFDTRFTNVGNRDYYIGPKPSDPNEPSTQFVFDPCHGHWHYVGYAEYVLFNSAGKRLAIGSKNGFCILDASCPPGIMPKYKCDNMGISVGCADVYDFLNTDCQWIDITDIPADKYTLVTRVNWDRSPDKLGQVEKTFDNNWAQACFELTYNGATPEVTFNADSCTQYTDCLGELFGPAQPDCNGVCNGPSLFGDWNQDSLRNQADIGEYIQAALADNNQATTCNDLHADAQINVFDAALLKECVLYADSVQHWIQRFPCQFPTGVLNPQDQVLIQPGALDTVAKTFVLEMANPSNRIMAYELIVSGLVIESVENLSPEFATTPLFNASTGKIIALSSEAQSIVKKSTPTPFLRIHYSQLSDHEVCLSEIVAVVNHQYQRSNAMLGMPNCLPVDYVGVSNVRQTPFAVYVQPNPMVERSTVYFDNPAAEPVAFTLFDMTGRVLRDFPEIRGNSVTVERGNLPAGTYVFTLRNSQGVVGGKILVR